MKQKSLFSFVIITLFASILSFVFKLKGIGTPFEMSFAPFFQVVGKSTSSINRALTKIIQVDSLDEKEYGEAIYERYRESASESSPEYIYLNDLITELSKYKKKPFNYKIILIDSYSPNAFAMPGGVIFVTSGLMKTLETESQIVAVLSHEMGHVEKSHCLDLVKFELLSRKIGSEALGKLADFAFNILTRHSYSKTQEDEADEYSFELMSATSYDPGGVYQAFQKLLAALYAKEERQGHVLMEYFMSHPYLELRIQKFREYADNFWLNNPGQKRYKGKKNFLEKIYFGKEKYLEEWVTGFSE